MAIGFAAACGSTDLAREPVNAEPTTLATTAQDVATAGASERENDDLSALDLSRHVPHSIARACHELERRSEDQRAERKIYCPPVVPAGRPQKIELAGGALRYRELADGYQVGVYMPRVSAMDGGHWTFGAGRRAVMYQYLHITGPIVNAKVIGRKKLAGTRVTIYTMPAKLPGFYAGHVIIEWRLGGTTFHVTMHGKRNRPRLEVMAVALIEEIRGA